MTEERRLGEQTIHDPTPLGPQCPRCEDTGSVAILRRGSPFFMEKMGDRPMCVTKIKAKRMLQELAVSSRSMMAILLASAIRDMSSTNCPNCVVP